MRFVWDDDDDDDDDEEEGEEADKCISTGGSEASCLCSTIFVCLWTPPTVLLTTVTALTAPNTTQVYKVVQIWPGVIFFFCNHNWQTLTCTCQSSTYSPNPSKREGGGCGFTLSRSHSCYAVRLVYTQISPGHIWTTLYFDWALHSRYMFRPFVRPPSGMAVQKSLKGTYSEVKREGRRAPCVQSTLRYRIWKW